MLYFLGAVITSFLFGSLSVIAAALFFLYKYKDDLFQLDNKPQISYEKNQLGNLLHYNLLNTRQTSTLGEKETCCFVNILFAFIFKEWRDTNQLQKWVLKKINIEFMEFMETKTASRLLQGIKIHDVSLGTNFPAQLLCSASHDVFPFMRTIGSTVFHSVKIKEPFAFNGDELPETITFEVDMEYLGGFFLAIDVDLVFGKNAFLAVRISYLKGRVRLSFGRQPCTHWSICFLEEPDIKFDVETSFETRQLPQLTSLIVNQIRRTIKRKHTFPQYKMRYNPFFSFQHPEISPFDGFIAEIPIQPAVLEVSVSAATRLLTSVRGEKDRSLDNPSCAVFATLSVNVQSCVGKRLLNYVSTPPPINDSDDFDILQVEETNKDLPTSSKSRSSTFDSIQRSLLGRKKDTKTDSMKKSQTNQSTNSEKSDDSMPEVSSGVNVREKEKAGESDSARSSVSTSPTYVMVALNFGATLREDTKKDGQKVVVVENITEHNGEGRSGMRDGDTVFELNGVPITSLSQAIATIERIRATKEAFKFKVKRTKSGSNTPSVAPNEPPDSDKSSGSVDTESDHSDVESDEYQDFVNISLQVAELHSKKNLKRRAASSGNCLETGSSSLSAGSDSNAEAPYMTLGTSSGSSKNQKEDDKDQHHVRSSSRVLGPIDKIISKRSRSESPPVARKSTQSNRNSPTCSTGTSEKTEQNKKEFPAKKERAPTPSLLSNFLSDFGETSSKTSGFPSKSSEQIYASKPENLSYARVDDELESQIYKTSLAIPNQKEYCWDAEKFSFNLKEQHRYLNIRFWAQQVNKLGVVKSRPPQIIGCVSIPLCEMELYCRGVTSRRVTRRFPLSAPLELPQEYKWFLNDSVSNRTSFREKYCYGDTTLTVKLLSNSRNQNNSSNYFNDAEQTVVHGQENDPSGMISKEMLNTLTQKTGMDFLLSTGTKSSKLLVSRQTQTGGEKNSNSVVHSPKEKSNLSKNESKNLQPDHNQNDNPPRVTEKVSLTRKLMGFLNSSSKLNQEGKKSTVSVVQKSISEDLGLGRYRRDEVTIGIVRNRKTGDHQFEPVKFSQSTKCDFCQSKLWTKSGLQCSACHAVCHKRCIDKFKRIHECSGSFYHPPNPQNQLRSSVLESDTEDGAISTSDSEGAPTAATSFRNRILDMTSRSQKNQESESNELVANRKRFLTKTAEDLLAVNAKEMGRDLHRDLPLSERKEMLQSQIHKVENELHTEIAEKEKLLDEQKSLEQGCDNWKKIWKKVVKTDERLQALALLLLHYRAGLEDCEFETTEEGMILSDDEDEKFGAVGSKLHPTGSKSDAGEASAGEDTGKPASLDG